MKYSNQKLTKNAQTLRRGMTKEERRLWYEFLKPSVYTVKRQHVIGKYIVDFYCPETKTVIELDGSQHFEKAGISSDAVRDAFLDSLGILVLRYSNADIERQFSSVCEDILRRFDERKAKAFP